MSALRILITFYCDYHGQYTQKKPQTYDAMWRFRVEPRLIKYIFLPSIIPYLERTENGLHAMVKIKHERYEHSLSVVTNKLHLKIFYATINCFWLKMSSNYHAPYRICRSQNLLIPIYGKSIYLICFKRPVTVPQGLEYLIRTVYELTVKYVYYR